jgi:hypothetical protein
MEVPRQTIPVYRDHRGNWYTSLELRYEHGERPEGTIRCGSIHSHAELSAYASHTDCVDEKHLDGIHAVVGHLDRNPVSLAASLTASGQRYSKYTYELIEPFDMERALAGGVPDEWLERVELEYTSRGIVTRRSLAEIVLNTQASTGRPRDDVGPPAPAGPTTGYEIEHGIAPAGETGDREDGNESTDERH